ncbi:MAG: hypothetical protein WCL57_17870 [Chloroflexota bacterium]|jgi:hypothetical protein|nr:hypothetical protein [Chloroflexota bacterium]
MIKNRCPKAWRANLPAGANLRYDTFVPRKIICGGELSHWLRWVLTHLLVSDRKIHGLAIAKIGKDIGGGHTRGDAW